MANCFRLYNSPERFPVEIAADRVCPFLLGLSSARAWVHYCQFRFKTVP